MGNKAFDKNVFFDILYDERFVGFGHWVHIILNRSYRRSDKYFCRKQDQYTDIAELINTKIINAHKNTRMCTSINIGSIQVLIAEINFFGTTTQMFLNCL